MSQHFLDEVPANDLPSLVFRYKEYTAAFHLYELALNPELKATLEEQTKAKEMAEALKTRLGELKQEIRNKIEELFEPLSQPSPPTTPEDLNALLELFCGILQDHDHTLQALVNRPIHSAPYIINNVNCGGAHGQPGTATPISPPQVPAPATPSVPTASEAPRTPGRVDIDLKDPLLLEIIRQTLEGIDSLPLRLTELGVPNDHQIPTMTGMLEKTARLRAWYRAQT